MFERFGELAQKEGAGNLSNVEHTELDALYAISEWQADVRQEWERLCQRQWNAALA